MAARGLGEMRGALRRVFIIGSRECMLRLFRIFRQFLVYSDLFSPSSRISGRRGRMVDGRREWAGRAFCLAAWTGDGYKAGDIWFYSSVAPLGSRFITRKTRVARQTAVAFYACPLRLPACCAAFTLRPAPVTPYGAVLTG